MIEKSYVLGDMQSGNSKGVMYERPPQGISMSRVQSSGLLCAAADKDRRIWEPLFWAACDQHPEQRGHTDSGCRLTDPSAECCSRQSCERTGKPLFQAFCLPLRCAITREEHTQAEQVTYVQRLLPCSQRCII